MIGLGTALAVAIAADARLPTGGWVVDYADAQCSAKRQFGTAVKPLFLIIKPSPTSNLVQLNVVRKAAGRSNARDEEVRLALGNGEPIALRQLSFAGSNNFEVSQVNLPAERANLLESTTRVGWSAPGLHIDFETGNLAPVMKTLSECRDRMRVHWNIGGTNEQMRQSAVKEITPLNSLFNERDYPVGAVRRERTGLASVIVLVDEQGRPRGCMLDETSGIASLDSMTCAVIRERARFAPAIGPDGKPMRSYYRQRVRWEVG